jgi:3-oxoacyl-[acyl-carrier protein] reductase
MESLMDLLGKKALVTGASRGIGAAIAKTLAARGADVAITYERSKEKAEEVVEGIERAGRKSIAIAADAADVHAVQSAVDKAVNALGGLDILVNNAGVLRFGSLEDLSQEDIDAILNVNIRAVIVAIKAASPHLTEGGRIVNIGSNLATSVPIPGLSVYSMSKAALIALTKGLARDLGPRGITVNLVHPGPTDTDMNPAAGDIADVQRGFIALGNYGTADDVANAVAFLASPAAKHITGAGLAVDGGTSA